MSVRAGTVSGTVRDDKGNPLPFASVFLKGTSQGVVAGSQGRYSFSVPDGEHVLVCQFVGYRSEEKRVRVSGDLVVDFQLSLQELKMAEVVIKRGEDPALEIIRQTIKKRSFYQNQVDSFSVDVYVKGQVKMRSIPERVMGSKVDRGDLVKQGFDSSGKGFLFLSESITKVSFARPDRYKYEVLSSRQSGGGYGVGIPFFVSFYTNNVQLFTNLNPRGFISPISDNAFHYYKFRYEGNFFEGNRMIDRIRVTPKRKNEPLFDGYIQIVDDEWRIHSLDLRTTKEYQLELLDTIRITQIQAPVTENVWRVQNQVIYFAARTFGMDWTADFLNVYNNYNLDPSFGKKHFNRVVLSYDTAFDKKDSSYWSRMRPIPLEEAELHDFHFRDSMYRGFRDSLKAKRVRDSINGRQPQITPRSLLLTSVDRHYHGTRSDLDYRLGGLLRMAEYNTVEGFVPHLVQNLTLRPHRGKKIYELATDLRYGWSNQHFNAWAALSTRPQQETVRGRFLRIAGGKRVSQFNHDNPVEPWMNSVYTLLYERNYLKIYENWFGEAEWGGGFESGLRWKLGVSWEDRIPLSNNTSYSWSKRDRVFLPNHPYELADVPFDRHQALVSTATVSFQPGQRYVQYPFGKVSIGSRYPTLELQYTKGIPTLLGSDVDYGKWRFSVTDEANLKMGGVFKYRVSIGGFLNRNRVEIPDYQHFNGNRTYVNHQYLNSFQLAPYYQYSNKDRFFTLAHVEHHFNGLLTNKIPLFNKLKWYLVAGSNAFYVDRNKYYVEAFAGIENIFKLFRVDFVTAYQTKPGPNFGIRIGLGGLLGGKLDLKR